MVTAEDPSLEPLQNRIRSRCLQRRVRLEEFFKTFDRLKTKKITRAQFSRALDDAQLRLSNQEVEVLIDRYSVRGDGLMVNYRQFCDAIDEVFTIKGLEAQPTLQVNSTLRAVPAQKHGEELSAVEQEELSQLLENLTARVRSGGLVVKDMFKDFDSNNAGTVTRAQFCRNVYGLLAKPGGAGGGTSSNSSSSMGGEYEATLLGRAFASSNGLDVSYRKLHAAVTPGDAGLGTRANAAAEAAAAAAAAAGGMGYTLTAAERSQATEIEDRLLQQTSRHRLRVGDRFRDWDRLRNGTCTAGQFKAGLRGAFPDMTPAEMEVITDKYSMSMAPPSGTTTSCNSDVGRRVRYVGFVNTMEAAFTEPHLERSPTKSLHSRAREVVLRPRRQLVQMQGQDGEMLNEVLSRISSVVATRRIMLLPAFQDFDRQRQEHITPDQFCRVLSAFAILPQNEKERELLLYRYTAQEQQLGSSTAATGRAQPRLARRGLVNFLDFCEDVDASLLQASPSKRSAVAEAAAADPPLLHFTTGGSASASASATASGALPAGVPAGGTNTFATAGRRAVTPTALGSPVAARVLGMAWPASPPRRSARGALEGGSAAAAEEEAEEEGRRFRALMRIVKEKVKRDRVRLVELFVDYDPLRHGHVTASQFSRGLSLGRMQMAPDEVQLLIDKYTVSLPRPASPPAPGGMPQPQAKPQRLVSWRAFVNDIDKVFTLKGLEVSPMKDVAAEVAQAQDDVEQWDDDLLTAQQQQQQQQQRGQASGTAWAGYDSAAAAAPGPYDSSSSSSSSSGQSDEEELAQVMYALRERVEQHRIQLLPTLQDFDSLRQGRISASSFCRSLSMCTLMPSPRALKLITAKFTDTQARGSSMARPDIHYRAFIAALRSAEKPDVLQPQQKQQQQQDSSSSSSPRRGLVAGAAQFRRSVRQGGVRGADASNAPPPAAAPEEPVRGEELTSLLSELREELGIRRARLTDFLQEGDKLRHGVLSRPKLRNALARCGVDLSPGQLAGIEEEFRADKSSDMIDWRALAYRLEGVPRLEASPTRNPKAPATASRARVGATKLKSAAASPTASGGGGGLSDDAMDAVLQKVRLVVAQRGVYMKPYFQDYDPHRSNQVSSTQFCAVLDKAGLQLSEPDQAALCQVFAVRRAGRGVNRWI